MTGRLLPLRHLSVRVPWHDAAWAGLVCNAPRLNGACVKLKGIAAKKNEERLEAVAGRSLEDLPEAQWPPCVDERATFMAPFAMEQIRRHALAKVNPEHYGHFKPTPQRYPAFSAGVVPFRWMMRGNMSALADMYELDVDESREPELGYESNWVHEAANQTALLNGFASQLSEDESLYLVYAKHVPFVEGTGRILIGAGRINQIGKLSEYKYAGEGMRGMVWERPIQHSIRPKGKDGFLFPYNELLTRGLEDPTFEFDELVPRIVNDHWDEFSYGSELVTHDGAIAALLALEAALRKTDETLGTSTHAQQDWLNNELIRLWKVRGPYPGLGAVLRAFGISRGVFVAHALQQRAGQNKDPWPLVADAFLEPAKLPKELRKDIAELAPTWKALSEERRTFLRLMSRFDLSASQAEIFYEKASRKKAGFEITDKEVIANPYGLFECSRHHPDGLPLMMVDRGIFPDDSVRIQNQLDPPSRLDSGVDLRRIRAFAIAALEETAASGSTVMPLESAVSAIADRAIKPSLPLTGDILSATLPKMAPVIVSVQMSGEVALQLDRYSALRDSVRAQVIGRVAGKRHLMREDWVALLDAKFGINASDEEQKARKEKAAALQELAESRFSVLLGPAGAGKTTLLSILCSHSAIGSEGILMLAPTGKARVRLQTLAGGNSAKAFTIAQFLNQHGRYDGVSGRYITSSNPKVGGFATVIVDESSMLTEDMVGALFDALSGVKRFIFVGDPSQLPPIGAGRPFADIVAKLRPERYDSIFPRVGAGYAELTIERRQTGADRPDLRLARWFSTSTPAPGEDDVFFCQPAEHATINFVEWRGADDFQQKLMSVLVKELNLANEDDVSGFNISLGATQSGGREYFNGSRGGEGGAVASVEKWQILSPLRGMPFGVGDINRLIHERYRKDFVELAMRKWHPIPSPMGAERIVYGDKVINLRNHRRNGKRVYPAGSLEYLANGEIGSIVGFWAKKGSSNILHVEFSSQKGFKYSFFKNDFSEEGEPTLELAYALTVHKAQGSQFNLVILVVPEAHPILSRELLYTALTRHETRVVVMHQGPRTLLKELASPHRSETAKRITNLMRDAEMVEVPLAKGSVFLESGLIHRTSRGLPVRSKSELIIAEALSTAGVQFEYEKALTLGGQTRYPDFTIENEISGRTIYWEHLGLLEREEYRKGWEKKQAWYRANGVLPAAEGEGPKGTLVTTTESSTTGFDTALVSKVIRQHVVA